MSFINITFCKQITVIKKNTKIIRPKTIAFLSFKKKKTPGTLINITFCKPVTFIKKKTKRIRPKKYLFCHLKKNTLQALIIVFPPHYL